MISSMKLKKRPQTLAISGHGGNSSRRHHASREENTTNTQPTIIITTSDNNNNNNDERKLGAKGNRGTQDLLYWYSAMGIEMYLLYRYTDPASVIIRASPTSSGA
jgi:hypothetical protein